jgi:tetratricopeptide (TPR) repeat protein
LLDRNCLSVDGGVCDRFSHVARSTDGNLCADRQSADRAQSGRCQTNRCPGANLGNTYTKDCIAKAHPPISDSNQGNISERKTLELGDELNVPFTAIVLREHVLLGSAADPGLAHEVLDQGKPVRLSELHRYGPMPPGGPAHVAASDFLPYYLDNLAARLADAGDLEPAERTFREAIHLAPKVARLRYNFGTFLVHRERYKEAEAELARAIRLGWKDADAYVNRGVARWKRDKPKDARRDFEEALRLKPGNRDAVVNLRQLGGR